MLPGLALGGDQRRLRLVIAMERGERTAAQPGDTRNVLWSGRVGGDGGELVGEGESTLSLVVRERCFDARAPDVALPQCQRRRLGRQRITQDGVSRVERTPPN